VNKYLEAEKLEKHHNLSKKNNIKGSTIQCKRDKNYSFT